VETEEISTRIFINRWIRSRFLRLLRRTDSRGSADSWRYWQS